MNIFSSVFNFLFPEPISFFRENSREEVQEKLLEEANLSAYGGSSWIYSPFSYGNPLVKKSIYTLKKRKSLIIFDSFGFVLSRTLFTNLLEDSLDFSQRKIALVPIPLSSKSLKNRGFNQAETLASSMCTHEDNLEIEDCLIEIKEHKKQATLTRNERLTNMHHVFKSVNIDWGTYIYIVLVDDVTTTGATLRSAKTALESAGCPTEKIRAITIAH